MNKYVERIFKNCEPDFKKLKDYGFTEIDGNYIYAADIMDGQFKLEVKISGCFIETTVTDVVTDEPYTLFLNESAVGSFVGAVRAVYEEVLCDIAEKCFEKVIFKSEYAQKIIRYVKDTYGDSPEFLWEKFSENAVWRRKDNKKWYGILLTVSKNKLGLPSEEKTEIIDLRAEPEEIETLVDGAEIFGGYHMNKKHWITICLDGSFPLDSIFKMLDKSYTLAKKR